MVNALLEFWDGGVEKVVVVGASLMAALDRTSGEPVTVHDAVGIRILIRRIRLINIVQT